MSDRSASAEALQKLGVLVGHWSVEPEFDDTPSGIASIDWALNHHYLVWRATIPDPKFPDSLSIVSVNADSETYTQHYFDSFGSTRTYKMTLDRNTLLLLRDEPDFTPLEFSQRFTAMISADCKTITGAWESSREAGSWRKDFDLVYRKTA